MYLLVVVRPLLSVWICPDYGELLGSPRYLQVVPIRRENYDALVRGLVKDDRAR